MSGEVPDFVKVVALAVAVPGLIGWAFVVVFGQKGPRE